MALKTDVSLLTNSKRLRILDLTMCFRLAVEPYRLNRYLEFSCGDASSKYLSESNIFCLFSLKPAARNVWRNTDFGTHISGYPT